MKHNRFVSIAGLDHTTHIVMNVGRGLSVAFRNCEPARLSSISRKGRLRQNEFCSYEKSPMHSSKRDL